MIYKKQTDVLKYQGEEYQVGTTVKANAQSVYEGLIGFITEIRTGKDKETKNPGPDIYCDFIKPNFQKELQVFQHRYVKSYNEPFDLDNINLDGVIMAPEKLVLVNDKKRLYPHERMGMNSIARQLQSDGLYLAGVPGFYRNDKDEWTFVNDNRGILIPVRDEEGRMQGLQIRLDNTEKRKFRWMSSTDRKDGCRAEGWTHFSGEPSDMLVLTEGPMKADVINALTGWTVVAVPGVNALKKLKASLETLKAKGLKRVQTAFDMDLLTNPNVKNGFEELLALLDEMDFTFSTYLWDPRYKGLDDYLWEGKLKKVRAEEGLVE